MRNTCLGVLGSLLTFRWGEKSWGTCGIFKIGLYSAILFRRSRRDLSIDVTEHESMMKYYQNTHYRRFSFIPKTGIAFSETGVLLVHIPVGVGSIVRPRDGTQQCRRVLLGIGLAEPWLAESWLAQAWLAQACLAQSWLWTARDWWEDERRYDQQQLQPLLPSDLHASTLSSAETENGVSFSMSFLENWRKNLKLLPFFLL